MISATKMTTKMTTKAIGKTTAKKTRKARKWPAAWDTVRFVTNPPDTRPPAPIEPRETARAIKDALRRERAAVALLDAGFDVLRDLLYDTRKHLPEMSYD
jgi:hypothetical protein